MDIEKISEFEKKLAEDKTIEIILNLRNKYFRLMMIQALKEYCNQLPYPEKFACFSGAYMDM